MKPFLELGLGSKGLWACTYPCVHLIECMHLCYVGGYGFIFQGENMSFLLVSVLGVAMR